MVLFLCILAAYVVGIMGVIILDGWFNFSNDNHDDCLIPICAFWPVIAAFLIVCSPVLLAGATRDFLREKRKQKEAKEKKLEKLRVAAQREVEEIEAQIEQELLGQRKSK